MLMKTTLSQGRAVSSLKLYAQAKLRLIDSCQNGTGADHYQKTNNVGSGTRSGISPLQAGLKCLTHTRSRQSVLLEYSPS